jgi:hypothetical protein
MQDTTVEKDLFWSHNLNVLFDKKRLIEFIPTSDMTQEEKLNALTRLSVYAGIILFVYSNKCGPCMCQY